MFYVQYSDSNRMKRISEVYKWRRKLKYFKTLVYESYILLVYLLIITDLLFAFTHFLMRTSTPFDWKISLKSEQKDLA